MSNKISTNYLLARIEELDEKVDNIAGGGEIELGELEDRVDAVEANITVLQNKDTTHDGQILALQNKDTDLQTQINNTNGRIDAIESGVDGIDFTLPDVMIYSDASMNTVIGKLPNSVITDGSISQSKINGLTTITGAFTGDDLNLANLGITSSEGEITQPNQLLQWTGARWKPSLIKTENIDDGQINTRTLFDGSVTDAKIVGMSANKISGTISTAQITDLAVTDAKVNTVSASKITGTIGSSQIADGSITDSKINSVSASKITGTITTSQYGDNTITDPKINTVSASKITGTIGTTQIADDSITDPKIDSVSWSKVTSTPSTFPSQTSTLTVNSNIALGTNKITTTATSFNDGELVSKDYVDSQVASAGVADNSITNAKLADMGANTIKGNNTGALADPKNLTVTEVKTMLGITNVANVDTTNASNITSGTLDADRLENNAIDNSKLSNMPTMTMKGNNTGISGVPIDLTVTQTKTMLGLNNVANSDTTNAANITSGTLNSARLPSIPIANIPNIPIDKIITSTVTSGSVLATYGNTSGAFKINLGSNVRGNTSLPINQAYYGDAIIGVNGWLNNINDPNIGSDVATKNYVDNKAAFVGSDIPYSNSLMHYYDSKDTRDFAISLNATESRIRSWQDHGIDSISFQQGNYAFQPLLLTDGAGYPYVRFDGSRNSNLKTGDDFFIRFVAPALGGCMAINFTIFLVVRYTATPTSNQYLLSADNPAGYRPTLMAADNANVKYSATTVRRAPALFLGSDVTMGSESVAMKPGFADRTDAYELVLNRWTVLCWQCENTPDRTRDWGSQVRLHIDKNYNVVNETSNYSYSAGSSNIALGSSLTDTLGFTGDMKLMMWYNRYFTQTELGTIFDSIKSSNPLLLFNY